MPTSSITVWLEDLAKGSETAAQEIWNKFFKRLVQKCRSRVRSQLPRAIVDEEDIALSAFDSFYRGAMQGRFPRLNDRSDVWQILLMLADRKTTDAIRFQGRAKRGSFRVRNISEFSTEQENSQSPTMFVDAEPLPDFVVSVADQLKYLLDILTDEGLRRIALLKLENFTNAEIADRIGKTVRSVEYKLRQIRELWTREFTI